MVSMQSSLHCILMFVTGVALECQAQPNPWTQIVTNPEALALYHRAAKVRPTS